MPNPTFTDLFNADQVNVDAAIASLGLPPQTDARTAIQVILRKLFDSYTTYISANAPLSTYTVSLDAENIDIDTQRQTFTFTVDMALVVGGADNEP